MDQHDKVAIAQAKSVPSILKLRIKGAKQEYDKDIIMFSCQGQRQGFTQIIKMKWMQVLSFIAMLAIFVAMTTCENNSTEGICTYKQEITVFGAGILLSLMAIRVAKRSKNKKKIA